MREKKLILFIKDVVLPIRTRPRQKRSLLERTELKRKRKDALQRSRNRAADENQSDTDSDSDFETALQVSLYNHYPADIIAC